MLLFKRTSKVTSAWFDGYGYTIINHTTSVWNSYEILMKFPFHVLYFYFLWKNGNFFLDLFALYAPIVETAQKRNGNDNDDCHSVKKLSLSVHSPSSV